MKFRKETPKHSGIYWYVDTEYPEPMLCWFELGSFNTGDTIYPLCGGMTVLKQSHYNHYRWGDAVEKPACVDNEIEY